MADQPSPRRRFHFRLRTLMMVVTLLAVASAYVAHEAKIVRDRQQERKWLVSRDATIRSTFVPPPNEQPYKPSVSWIRGILGDEAVAAIYTEEPLSNDDEQRLRRVFPEVRQIGTLGGL